MQERLEDTAARLITTGHGFLAADESTPTITKRFDTINLASTPTSRRDYREMLFRTDAAMQYISGVILYEETLYQTAADGTPFVDLLHAQGSIAGIKVDTGAKPLAFHDGETITEGLDGLRERLDRYRETGARFAKWRGVLHISEQLPTAGAVKANAQALARYGALCQEAGLVPIIEPECLMDGQPGTHTIERSAEVTAFTLRTVFEALNEARVKLEGMILKPNMVIDGKNARKASVEQVADWTIRVLKQTVPPAVPGIAFLSGGQSAQEATAHLAAMNAGYDVPWVLTFSYGRALQDDALKAWGGQTQNKATAQTAFAKRARMNSLAATGQWSRELESAAEMPSSLL